MRIGEMAERAGVSTRSLRYYEKQGLIQARRGSNGYREYDEADLPLVAQIRSLLNSGFSLEETRPFVECLRSGNESGDSCPDSVAVYRRKLADLDEQISALAARRDEIAAQLAAACPTCVTHADETRRNVITLTADNFEEQVLKADKPVLVDFWADWCGPCKMLAPVLEEMAAEESDRMIIGKIDGDAHPQITAQYGIMGFPTLLLFRDGEVIHRISGAKPKRLLMASLQNHL